MVLVRLMPRVAIVVVATVVGIVSLVPAAAGRPWHRVPPDLVVLGDSFAAGTGNMPYEDPDCGGRSLYDSYGKYLGAFGVVRLQAVAACGGATTTEVVPQLSSITADTDVVTVQALGNDYFFGSFATLCLYAAAPGCVRSATLPGVSPQTTVEQALLSIEETGEAKLDVLFDAIDARLAEFHSTARILVVAYANPFPAPGTRNANLCQSVISPLAMSTQELEVAQAFTNALNSSLGRASMRPNYRYVNASPWFVGRDLCGPSTAFYRPFLPELNPLPGSSSDPLGGLHPNRLGHAIYAAAVGARLYF